LALPRVLFVGSTAYDVPLDPGLARKWEAVSEVLDVRVVARARDGSRGDDPRFRLVRLPPSPVRGASFYAALPAVVRREVARFRPDVVIAESPYEAFASLPALGRASRPRMIVELHGDWRTASRLYGSRLRRLYAPLADRGAVLAVRRADRIRPVSTVTARLAEEIAGRAPDAVFPAYIDLSSFTREPPRPLPAEPAIAWIGTLQRYKNPALMAAAWREVAAELPAARLTMVGDGPLRSVVDALVAEFPGRVRAIPRLTSPEVARLLDDSTLLALSSESEGLPRVALEALARARPVVTLDAGGVTDAVVHGRNGLVVPQGDVHGLSRALLQVLARRDLAERLGRAGHEDSLRLRWTPERYAAALRELVDDARRPAACA
jgi:glycosyltransferase involved in cell wall biosynthesis